MMMWPFFDDGAGRERPGAPDADALLALRVAAALEADDLTRGHGIEVGVQHGVVILAGVVDTRRTRDEITARVRQTPGVRDVSDALLIRGGTPTDEHGGIAQHDWTDDFDAITARLVSDPPIPTRSARSRPGPATWVVLATAAALVLLVAACGWPALVIACSVAALIMSLLLGRRGDGR